MNVLTRIFLQFSLILCWIVHDSGPYTHTSDISSWYRPYMDANLRLEYKDLNDPTVAIEIRLNA